MVKSYKHAIVHVSWQVFKWIQFFPPLFLTSFDSGPNPTRPQSILPSIGPKSQRGCGSLKEMQQHRNKAILCLEIMSKCKDWSNYVCVLCVRIYLFTYLFNHLSDLPFSVHIHSLIFVLILLSILSSLHRTIYLYISLSTYFTTSVIHASTCSRYPFSYLCLHCACLLYDLSM